MRRILSYILAPIAALLLASCAECPEPQEIAGSFEIGEEHNGKVTLKFTPDFGGTIGTKALAQNPTVENIYFAVFDMGNKLSEYVEAVLDDPAANVNGTKFTYSVELTVSGQQRVLHILANAPKSMSFGSESEVIGSLYTKYEEGEGKDAYWQRIVVPGIYGRPDPSTSGSDPEYDAKLARYNNLLVTLSDVKLLRNFASVTVHTDNTSNFILKGFWLTNIPDRGSYAPYNRKTKDFENGYLGYTSVELAAGYDGFTPSSAALLSVGDYAGSDLEYSDGGFSSSELGQKMVQVSDPDAGATAYCYERELPKDNPVYIIVCGRFTGTGASGKDTFYKIDLRNKDDEYFPILRNFNYKIKVRSVSRDGALTVDEALSSSPSGDISTSLDMAGLTNISDGNAQIWVSETERVIIGATTNTEPITWSYKFLPDVEHSAAVANTPLDMMVSPYPGYQYADEAAVRAAGKSYVTLSQTTGSTGAVFSSLKIISLNDGDEHFCTVQMYPVPASDVTKTQTVTITGWYPVTVGGETVYKSITRQAVFRLRERLTMDVKTDPEIVDDTKNSKVDIIIEIEPNLPSSVFPLEMSIEAEKNSLAPDIDGRTGPTVELPVATGTSLFNEDQPGYHYVRTITWSEYESAPLVNGKKQFDSYFKTNCDVSATQIKVANKYYLPGNTYFKNPGDGNAFYGLEYNNDLLVGTAGVSKTDFSFLTTTAATVTITLTGANELACGSMTVNPTLTKVDASTYTMEVADKGTYYIHGISASGYNDPVVVTLSATADGYADASKTIDRLAYLGAGQNISSDNLSVDFGATVWAGSGSIGTLHATTAGGVEFDIPVRVTRVSDSVAPDPETYYFDAPARRSGVTGEISYSNGGTNNRTITLNLNAEAGYNYYYYYDQTNGSDPADKTVGTIMSDSQTLTLPELSRTTKGRRTVYVRRERQDDLSAGITSIESSGWSTIVFQKTSTSSRDWSTSASFTKATGNANRGSYSYQPPVPYIYSFDGPLSDVTFKATGLTLSASDIISLSYGGVDFGRIYASRLENDVKADVVLQRPSELGLTTPDDQTNLIFTAKGTEVAACRYCLLPSATVDAATDMSALLTANGIDMTSDQLTRVKSSAGCQLTVSGLTPGVEYEVLCQFTDSKGNTAFYSATRRHTAE